MGFWSSKELERKRAVSWVRLLACAKNGAISVEFCGRSEAGFDLWQIRQGEKILALQGNEPQVIEAMQLAGLY